MTKLNASKMSYKEALKISKKLPDYKYLLSVGSVESKQPFPQDLDFLTTINLKLLSNKFIKKFPETWNKTKLGLKRFDYYPIIDGKKIVINIWKVDKNNLHFFYFTYGYPRGFVIAMRKKAKLMGYKLSQYGLFKNNKKIKELTTLKKIFKFFKLPYRSPEEEYLKHKKK